MHKNSPRVVLIRITASTIRFRIRRGRRLYPGRYIYMSIIPRKLHVGYDRISRTGCRRRETTLNTVHDRRYAINCIRTTNWRVSHHSVLKSQPICTAGMRYTCTPVEPCEQNPSKCDGCAARTVVPRTHRPQRKRCRLRTGDKTTDPCPLQHARLTHDSILNTTCSP